MIVEKTYIFGIEQDNFPSFGITLRAGDDPSLECTPHRVLPITSYQYVEMLCFSIDEHGKRNYTKLSKIPQLYNVGGLGKWNYVTLAYDDKIGANCCPLNFIIKSLIPMIRDAPSIEQYESEEE